jgi:hypothetical protein
VIDTGSSPRRYENVYSKTLKLHKGSDTRLQFQFLSQDQKPVNITGKEITFRLISYDNHKILLQQSLVNTLALNGITELRVHADSIKDINPQKCYYSLELPDELGLNVPGLMDKNGTGRGDIDVVNSVYPARVAAQQVNVTTGSGTFYSDILNTKYSPKMTIQVAYTEFSGNTIIQGSTNSTSDWYDIEVFNYDAPIYPTGGSNGYIITGFHPYIRVKFERVFGDVNNILAR